MNNVFRFLFPAKPYGAAESWLLLAARIVFGLMLLSHGMAKWANFDTLSEHFPPILGMDSRLALVLAIFAEVICSAGFIVGAFYRLALIPMTFTMAMAAFVAHHGDPFAVKELAVMYMAVFVLMFFAGPGGFSLDRLIAGRINQK